MVGRTAKRRGGARTGARCRGVLTTRNGDPEANINLIRQYETFIETLENQILRIKAQRDEELRLLDEQEIEHFHRTCNLYTEEQLSMPAAEFEAYLAKVEQDEQDAENGQHFGGDYHAEVAADPFRIPLPTKPKPAPKKKAGKGRVSMGPQQYNSATRTPAWRPRAPKFMTAGTGIKNMQPRVARVGEFAYSDNGSPIVVCAAAEGATAAAEGRARPATRGKTKLATKGDVDEV
ncbi:hypothetical protein BV898_13445 [Hypsibius exemplaris]|uniref:Uncharacterized protein n=1 Tax=Hypsibius exemplaris TaxID=2072580 RepID=A0A1W0WAQ3_HYPEX|nr:hypothetical protein BV898_13445 [Hypsibius exemplaris]